MWLFSTILWEVRHNGRIRRTQAKHDSLHDVQDFWVSCQEHLENYPSKIRYEYLKYAHCNWDKAAFTLCSKRRIFFSLFHLFSHSVSLLHCPVPQLLNKIPTKGIFHLTWTYFIFTHFISKPISWSKNRGFIWRTDVQWHQKHKQGWVRKSHHPSYSKNKAMGMIIWMPRSTNWTSSDYVGALFTRRHAKLFSWLIILQFLKKRESWRLFLEVQWEEIIQNIWKCSNTAKPEVSNGNGGSALK